MSRVRRVFVVLSLGSAAFPAWAAAERAPTYAYQDPSGHRQSQVVSALASPSDAVTSTAAGLNPVEIGIAMSDAVSSVNPHQAVVTLRYDSQRKINEGFERPYDQRVTFSTDPLDADSTSGGILEPRRDPYRLGATPALIRQLAKRTWAKEYGATPFRVKASVTMWAPGEYSLLQAAGPQIDHDVTLYPGQPVSIPVSLPAPRCAPWSEIENRLNKTDKTNHFASLFDRILVKDLERSYFQWDFPDVVPFPGFPCQPVHVTVALSGRIADTRPAPLKLCTRPTPNKKRCLRSKKAYRIDSFNLELGVEHLRVSG